MIVEEALVQLLKSGGADPLRQDAAEELAGHIGAGVNARIHGLAIPQSPGTSDRPKYPAVVYRRVSGPRAHSMTGSSGYASPVFQFECHAQKYPTAKAMVNLVRQVLDGFAGVVGTNPNTVDINGILVDGDDDGYDEGEQVPVCTIDFMVMHNE